MVVQISPLTVTPSGRGKSVTVTECHSKRVWPPAPDTREYFGCAAPPEYFGCAARGAFGWCWRCHFSRELSLYQAFPLFRGLDNRSSAARPRNRPLTERTSYPRIYTPFTSNFVRNENTNADHEIGQTRSARKERRSTSKSTCWGESW